MPEALGSWERDGDQPRHVGTTATIELRGAGAVRELVLNRPGRHNAQNLSMWHEVSEAVGQLGSDPDVTVLVVRGCGQSFSSGIDLEEFTRPGGFIRSLIEHPQGSPDPMLASIKDAQRVVVALREAPFLTVAQLSGAVLGAGMQLALACDIRITADDARWALLECRRQLLPDLGATSSLPRLIGRERALDLILTGREMTGREAAEAGVALRSVPLEELDSTVAEYVRVVAGTSRTAVGFVKAAVDARDEHSSLSVAAMGQAACIRQLRSSSEQSVGEQ